MSAPVFANPTPVLIGVAPGGYNRLRKLPKGDHKRFRIERKKLWKHYELRYENGERFFVNLPGLMPGGTDLTFHNGPYKNSPVTAECRLEKKSDDLRIRLRDMTLQEKHTDWQDVKFDRDDVSWRLHLPVQSHQDKKKKPDGDHDLAPYAWKRAPPPYEKDQSTSTGRSDLELVSEATGERAAVLRNDDWDFERGGEAEVDLEIEVDEGEDFDRLVCLTATALYEKAGRNGGGSKGSDALS